MSAESGVLQVKATGKFSLEEAKRTFVEMIHSVMQRKVAKVLFDGRAIEGDPEFMERFYYGEFAARTVVSYFVDNFRSPLFAYVLKEPVLDPGRFGETVAANRGMQVKTFDDVEQARTWLGLPSRKPADDQ